MFVVHANIDGGSDLIAKFDVSGVFDCRSVGCGDKRDGTISAKTGISSTSSLMCKDTQLA